jgi:hypothetical protein
MGLLGRAPTNRTRVSSLDSGAQVVSLDLTQYDHLWENVDRGWVLLKTPNRPGKYCVFNKSNNVLLLIERDEENDAVCDRMKQLGFEVLETIPSGMRNVDVKLIKSSPDRD